MTDYYEEAVVEHPIPAALVNPVDLELLAAFGFAWAQTNEGYTFYAEEGLLSFYDVEDARELLRGIEDEYPSDAARPEWVCRLAEALAPAAAKDESCELEFDELSIHATDVFHAMLCKPQNRGAGALEEILVEGAYYANKTLPGAVGGFVWVITRAGYAFGNTHDLVNRLRLELRPRGFTRLCRALGWKDGPTGVLNFARR